MMLLKSQPIDCGLETLRQVPAKARVGQHPKQAVPLRQLPHALNHYNFANALALSNALVKIPPKKLSLKFSYGLFLFSCLVRIVHERIATQNELSTICSRRLPYCLFIYRKDHVGSVEQ